MCAKPKRNCPLIKINQKTRKNEFNFLNFSRNVFFKNSLLIHNSSNLIKIP